MSFGQIQSGFISLRKRLTVAVGPTALPDINIDPPKGEDDELSFLRLVAWTYVLLHESGKISLNFLRRLPPWNEKDLLPHVRPLRTWMSHNLSLNRDSDLQTMSQAVAWFHQTCGAGTPQTKEQWRACFSTLSKDLDALLSNAISVCDIFESLEDGERLKEELNSKLDRNWDAYRFDKYVAVEVNRLGYCGIDVVAFRNRFLNDWRKIVAASTPEHIERNLTLRIDADILNEMKNSLPLTAEEFDTLVVMPNADALVVALLILKAQTPQSRPALLDLIRKAVGQR